MFFSKLSAKIDHIMLLEHTRLQIQGTRHIAGIMLLMISETFIISEIDCVFLIILRARARGYQIDPYYRQRDSFNWTNSVMWLFSEDSPN